MLCGEKNTTNVLYIIDEGSYLSRVVIMLSNIVEVINNLNKTQTIEIN